MKLGRRRKSHKGRAGWLGLLEAFYVIEKPVVEPMDRFVALLATLPMPPAPLSSALSIRNNICRQFVVCRELLKSK